MTKTLCIVSCTAHKRGTRLPAEELYASPLFFKSRRYAQSNFDDWLILSAEHGLIRPDQVLKPYDTKLASISKKQRNDLIAKVRQQARRLLEEKTRLFSICGAEYDNLLRDAGLTIHKRAEFALPIGKKLQALTQETDPNGSEADLDKLYKIVGPLAKMQGVPRLQEMIERPIPSSGLYLFFDDHERRLKDNQELRIVRVGTHGIAAGSKASLRTRIRTHLGTASGEGNHRSSIFRLHAGQSLIKSGQFREIATWGNGAIAKKEFQVAEKRLEQAVSRYLGDLRIIYIAVPGESEKSNDRAYLEQNLIALLSNKLKPLDPPTFRWLGRNSDRREVRKSGLWNVNHALQNYDKAFLEILSYYVSLTVGTEAPPKTQMAPPDWLARVRDDRRQLSLL